VKSADGKYDNYYRLIKPLGFDPAKKYPVILYVYGGPHSQMVRNSYQAQLRRWEMYMAQRGYVVFVMDNRGTSNRGAEYEKAIHKQCGQCEMQDQMAGMLAHVAPVGRQQPHRRPRLELRRIHDHISHDKLPRRLQGRRCGRSGNRLAVV